MTRDATRHEEERPTMSIQSIATTRRPLTADSTGSRVTTLRADRPADEVEDREDVQRARRPRKVRLSHSTERERDWLAEDERRGAFSIWAS
jgi:hypothetical protein